MEAALLAGLSLDILDNSCQYQMIPIFSKIWKENGILVNTAKLERGQQFTLIYGMSGRSPIKSPPRKKIAAVQQTVNREKTSPYKLRDTSKLPSRYRDEEIDVPPLRARTPGKNRTPTKPVV
ncbi:hypothetical protein Y032_0275g1064 [Ancylostoma ceylanicum]|uniref:Uncharacterized protein n=1 Tax=Ancylostoma ceylanicum TaxID=53326 RepID=A0A016S8T0_9BILA|nr:hypothetical protein Y032_0275g1064 [Ancylostoma ceylanicum]